MPSTDINWTSERIEYLKRLWLLHGPLYMSTSEIARSCSHEFREPVSKNAIVGKVHRIGLDGRPSPIGRASGGSKSQGVAASVTGARATLPPLDSMLTLKPAPLPAAPVLFVPGRSNRSSATLSTLRACEFRPNPTGPCRRRDGSGCYWPIGEPKTPGFRFCDNSLTDITLSYCPDHARDAYTRIQIRRREDATDDE